VAIKHALSTKHSLPGCVMLSSWTEAIPGTVSLSAQCMGSHMRSCPVSHLDVAQGSCLCSAMQLVWPLGEHPIKLDTITGLLLQIPQHVKDCNFFVGHGSSDPLIPPAMAMATVALLKSKG
jgi:hypothetical protein